MPAKVSKAGVVVNLNGIGRADVPYAIPGDQVVTQIYGSSSLYSSVDLSGCAALEFVDFRNASVLQSIDLAGCTSLTEVNVENCGGLTTVDLTGCAAVAAAYFSNNDIGAVDLSDCVALISVYFDSNSLTESAVDGILADLDAAGLSNGTVDLSAGANAIPSAAGLTSKSNLEGKGWTVTVNS
jgi:hypothetical protein